MKKKQSPGLIVVGNLKEGANILEWLIRSEEIEVEGIDLRSDVQVSMEITKSDNKLIISGRANFRGRVNCAFCGEEFERDFMEQFTSCYIKGKPAKTKGKGLAVFEEEIDQVYYQGDFIDLLSLLRDTILLAVPIAPDCGCHTTDTSR